MSTQTKEGGKQSHGKKNNIVRFKLSLGRGMNSEDVLRSFVYAFHHLGGHFVEA